MNAFYIKVVSVLAFGYILCHDENTTTLQEPELHELEKNVGNLTERQKAVRLRIKALQRESLIEQKEPPDSQMSVYCYKTEEPEDPMARLKIRKFVDRINKLEKDIKTIESYVKSERETDTFLLNLNGTIGQEFDDIILQVKRLSADMKEELNNSLKVVDNKLESVKDFANSRNVIIGELLYYDGIGSPCSSSFDVCRVERSECRDGLCQCAAGLSHNSLQEKCEENCEDGYSNTYQTVHNYIIRGHNNAVLNETTLKQCKERCETEEDFVCRSFDYFPRWKSCFLSEIVKGNAKEFWEYNNAGFHYQRDCAISNQ